MQKTARGCSNIVTLDRDLLAIVEAKVVGYGRTPRISSPHQKPRHPHHSISNTLLNKDGNILKAIGRVLAAESDHLILFLL